MNEITAPQKFKNPYWTYAMVFIGMSASILARGPDPIQRILLMLALGLAYSDIMRGYGNVRINWLVNGLFTYYQLFMSLTLVVIVTWQGSAAFWEKAPKFAFGLILVSALVTAFYALKERGKTENAVEHIPNARFLFGSIIIWQVAAQVCISFAPEVSIAQVSAFIIPLGFIAQPFAPSQPLPFAPFLTLKRLSFVIVILVLLAEAYWP